MSGIGTGTHRLYLTERLSSIWKSLDRVEREWSRHTHDITNIARWKCRRPSSCQRLFRIHWTLENRGSKLDDHQREEFLLCGGHSGWKFSINYDAKYGNELDKKIITVNEISCNGDSTVSETNKVVKLITRRVVKLIKSSWSRRSDPRLLLKVNRKFFVQRWFGFIQIQIAIALILFPLIEQVLPNGRWIVSAKRYGLSYG